MRRRMFAGAGKAMSLKRFARLARWLEELFPERHIYLRSGGEMRGFVLSTQRQMLIAGLIAATGLWLGVSTAATCLTPTAWAMCRSRLSAPQWADSFRLWSSPASDFSSSPSSGGAPCTV